MKRWRGERKRGWERGEAQPFFSLLFLGIWKLLLMGLSGSSGPLGSAAAPASGESWSCSWQRLGAASEAAVSSGPAPPPGSAMLRPPPFCGEDSSSGSVCFISSSPPPLSQFASVGGETSTSAAVAIAPAWGAPGSFGRQGRRGWGEGAAGRPRRRAALSPPTPFPPWPRAAIPAQQPLRGPKAGAPTVPPGPGSRSLLGQFFSRPPPLNVLASGPGGGVAITERSANEDAAPASAGADRRRQGAESRSARARQKGRPQRPTSTSTPLRLRVRWVSWRAARSRSAFGQCCRRGRRAAAKSWERRRRLFPGKITSLLRARLASARTG